MSCKYNNCKICGYKTECEIYKENAELEKSCDETQELLDKQIEATYKLDKENAELKKENAEAKNLKEELNQKGLALQSDMDKTIEQNIALKKELNKANEWHYVKDRDYPKDNKPVLCILGDIGSDSYEVGYYNDVESGEPWHFENYYLPDDDGDNAWGVSAWKEIVLPKESE